MPRRESWLFLWAPTAELSPHRTKICSGEVNSPAPRFSADRKRLYGLSPAAQKSGPRAATTKVVSFSFGNLREICSGEVNSPAPRFSADRKRLYGLSPAAQKSGPGAATTKVVSFSFGLRQRSCLRTELKFAPAKKRAARHACRSSGFYLRYWFMRQTMAEM